MLAKASDCEHQIEHFVWRRLSILFGHLDKATRKEVSGNYEQPCQKEP